MEPSPEYVPPLWVEVWRTAIVILGFAIVGQITVLYRWRMSRGYGSRPGELHPIALLSWAILVFFLVVAIVTRYGAEVTWRSPLATVAFLIAEYALYRTLKGTRGSGTGRASLNED